MVELQVVVDKLVELPAMEEIYAELQLEEEVLVAGFSPAGRELATSEVFLLAEG